jgi:hypothetical protein
MFVLRTGSLMVPALILSYLLGLKHGPQRVAVGFSITMVLSAVPVMLAAKQGTLITVRDILRAVAPSVASIAIGTSATLAFQSIVSRVEPPFAGLVAESAILFGVYLFTLFFIMKQKAVYGAAPGNWLHLAAYRPADGR